MIVCFILELIVWTVLLGPIGFIIGLLIGVAMVFIWLSEVGQQIKQDEDKRDLDEMVDNYIANRDGVTND